MKKIFYPGLITGLILTFNLLNAVAQIPDGGSDIINDPLRYYNKYGKGTMSIVDVEGQSFSKAIRFETPVDVANPWDAQVVFRPLEGIQANDVILVSFFGRTISSAEETGEGLVNVVIENKSDYSKVLYQGVTMGSEWQQYFTPVKTSVSLEQNNLNCALFFGFPSQTVEIADIRFINYNDTKTLEELPETEITYSGREPDAPWRLEAQQRIDQIRKGDLEIIVLDSAGNAVSGAEVSLSMLQHKFGFGSAIVASEYMTNSTYKEKIHELFNEVVFENDLKWTDFIYKSSVQKQQVIDVLDDLEQHNIKMRGHNVIWPSWKFSPVYLSNYKTDPDRIRREIDNRIDNISSFTRGRVIDWDVINEPYSEHDFMDLLGREAMADWFKRVRNNDPNVKLYLNDYGILSSNGIDYKKQDSYIETARYIEELGGEVQGIGLQGHFSSNLTPITRLKTVLDKFSVLEKDIKITEFDIAFDQEEVQADYTRDFLTMAFSHPSVQSVLMWGFWENRHWEPEAAMYRSDWSIKPNGETYKKLVFDEWWTKDTILITDENGKVALNGFLGRYSWSVSYNGKENSGTFNLENPVSSDLSNNYSLSVESGIPATLSINVEGETLICEGESTELSVILSEDFTVQWFKDGTVMGETSESITVNSAGSYHAVATGKGMSLDGEPVEITVHEFPSASLEVSGNLTFCPGGSVSLQAPVGNSYTYKWFRNGDFHFGSVPELEVSESGSYKVEVNSFGCKSVSEEIALTKLAPDDPSCTVGFSSNEIELQVYPNPFTRIIKLNLQGSLDFPVKLEIIDLNGRILHESFLKNAGESELELDIESGYYLLKITAGDAVHFRNLIRQ